MESITLCNTVQERSSYSSSYNSSNRDKSYNLIMLDNRLVFGSDCDFAFLRPVKDAAFLGNNDQKDFAENVLDAVIRAIPFNRISSFQSDSFQSFLNTDDNSITIEFNIPNIYFCVDIEENTINSSWTLSTSEEAGRISEGGFFYRPERIGLIINYCIKKILEWI